MKFSPTLRAVRASLFALPLLFAFSCGVSTRSSNTRAAPPTSTGPSTPFSLPNPTPPPPANAMLAE